MGVVRLLGGDDRLAGGELAGHPQGFQIGEGTAAGQVAKMLIPAEHRGDFCNRLGFHAGAGAAAVKGVIVGVEPRSHGIGRARNRVRRLEHLSGIQGMKVRVVVPHAASGFFEHSGHGSGVFGEGSAFEAGGGQGPQIRSSDGPGTGRAGL